MSMKVTVELSDDLIQKVQRYAKLHQLELEVAVCTLIQLGLDIWDIDEKRASGSKSDTLGTNEP